MQRAVGMSEQEVGGTASHEQSAEEIRTIHTATGHRAEYVASWVDFSFEAWKRQLFTFYTQYRPSTPTPSSAATTRSASSRPATRSRIGPRAASWSAPP
jgi:hypothetical protein